jgi:steroid 5-alpha reductase family enzyme
LLAALWLIVTLTGYRRARQRRYVEHRRWMIRSFALSASIITNRVWGVIAYLLLSPQLNTTLDGSEKMLSWTIAGLATWLGWVGTLLVAEWWLEKDALRARPIALEAQGA